MKFTEIVLLAIRFGDDRRASECAKPATPGAVAFAASSMTAAHYRERFLDFLEDLPPVVAYWLFAVAYIGRGSGNAADPWGTVDDLREWFPRPGSLPGLMASEADLFDQLRRGLAAIAKDGIDLDAELGEWPAATCPTSTSTSMRA
jgi:hypothetical protein